VIKSINHVALSVSNLDRAIEFYRDALGMGFVVRTPFAGDEYEAVLGLEGAQGQVALLRLGEVHIELFEFERPKPGPLDPNYPVSDHGISHFCLEVTDIQGEYERLKAAGARFHCPPQHFFGTAIATYGRDPDGNVFELLQMNESANESKEFGSDTGT